MIKEFKEKHGKYIEMVPGHKTMAYSLSENDDIYDLTQYDCRGTIISFLDLKTGEVYHPIEQERNVVCSRPLAKRNFCYFLKADKKEDKVTLYRWKPDKLTTVKTFKMSELNTYNLSLMGEGINVISQGDQFDCYYPERFSFPLQPNETVVFMSEDMVYVEAWIEEGWDSEHECPGENYAYYDMIRKYDHKGKLLSEEKGTTFRDNNGQWWIG